MTALEYYNFLIQYQTYFADEVIKPAVLLAADDVPCRVEKRYLTGEGSNDQAWINALKEDTEDDTGNVNVICVAFVGLGGVGVPTAIGTTSKDINILVDYYRDYQVDPAKDSYGKFMKNIIFADWFIDSFKAGGSLPNNARVKDYSFRFGIKRFPTQSCHFATGVIQVEIPFIQK